MKRIPLTQGRFALVDDVDFDILSKFKWCASKQRNNCYAVRTIIINGKKTITCMHHQIMGESGAGLEIDHIDRDGLNNQRNNLRQVNKSTNLLNHRMYSTNSSGHTGICWVKNRQRWLVTYQKDCKQVHVGYFKTLDDAVIAKQNAR